MTTTDKPDSVAATLRAARALIEDPKRWTKGTLAKTSKRADDVNGAVSPHSEKAGAWCAVGAIKRVDGSHEDAALILLAHVIEGSDNSYPYDASSASDDIVDYNDAVRRRHREVLAKFDAAIAAAEKAEQAAVS